MKEQEIIEGNKLIAEFLGWKILKGSNRMSVYMDALYQDDLNYHSSWNWLMPVVEKIEALCNTDYDTSVVYIADISCTIEVRINNSLEYSKEINSDKKINATFKSVVEFIKWYNEQKGETK